MRTNRPHTARRRPWLATIAGTLLLAGCGSPYAWNDYLNPGYSWDKGPLLPPSSVPAVVTGSFGNISTDELRSAVADGLHAPSVAAAPQGQALQGSSTPGEPATRTVWTFSFTPSASDVGTAIHVLARYYSNNELISTAEGTGVITGGGDPRLREIVADVAGEFFPTVPRGGPGRG
jgi:hypothetical protein